MDYPMISDRGTEGNHTTHDGEIHKSIFLIICVFAENQRPEASGWGSLLRSLVFRSVDEITQ